MEQINGARNLGSQPRGDAATPAPDVTPPSQGPDAGDIGSQIAAADVAAQADEARQQANRRYDAILSREQVLEQTRNAFGATQRELDVVRVIMELFAEQWAERTGRPADEWWQWIAGVERDGDGYNNLFQQMSDEEVVNLLSRDTVPFRQIELTPENWRAEFGETLKVKTPMGEVKIGENQYHKLVAKERGPYFGLIKPTLEDPLLILKSDRGATLYIKVLSMNKRKSILFLSAMGLTT